MILNVQIREESRLRMLLHRAAGLLGRFAELIKLEVVHPEVENLGWLSIRIKRHTRLRLRGRCWDRGRYSTDMVGGADKIGF